jgi:hypothetical protein
MNFNSAQAILSAAGIQIDAGLATAEFNRIEQKFGFQFPPDLRDFLSAGLPKSHHWIDWRDADEESIKDRLNWPFDGMCFDIEHNSFWPKEWGERPKDLKEAIEIARCAFHHAPILVPIYSHRYIPALPHERGNPVFSIYQTDIIYYGKNLMDYLQNEFKSIFGRADSVIAGNPKEIPFWSTLAG